MKYRIVATLLLLLALAVGVAVLKGGSNDSGDSSPPAAQDGGLRIN
jgi:hypothetical protein